MARAPTRNVARLFALACVVLLTGACATLDTMFSAVFDEPTARPAPPPKKPLRRYKPGEECPMHAHAYYLDDTRRWVRNIGPETEQFGLASWYGRPFHGRQTANGERYDMYANTAAHKALPMGSLVEVTNLQNNMRTIVRINDRGPFIEGRIIDLSFGAAKEIDMLIKGVVPIRMLVIAPGKR